MSWCKHIYRCLSMCMYRCIHAVCDKTRKGGSSSSMHHLPRWSVGQRGFERSDIATLNRRKVNHGNRGSKNRKWPSTFDFSSGAEWSRKFWKVRLPWQSWPKESIGVRDTHGLRAPDAWESGDRSKEKCEVAPKHPTVNKFSRSDNLGLTSFFFLCLSVHRLDFVQWTQREVA